MESVVRAIVVYTVLLALFRIAGKRSLGDVTTFDLVLTLIISEAVQEALIDSDNSMTNALLLVTTLIGVNVLLSHAKRRSPWLERVLDGVPVVVVRDGRLQREPMAKERVDEADILHAARELEGLERMEQVKHAVVEASGKITVVPRERSA